MQLDKQHPRPVYLQLKEMLRSQIEQGVYLAHQKLPSERDLCQHYNLSRMTARRALQELIDEGFAYTRTGKGTFTSGSLTFAGRTLTSQFSAANHLTLDGEVLNDQHQRKLVELLSLFDCVGVERVISEMLASYSLEAVARELFGGVIRYFERQWHKGEVSLSIQNYAITTLRSYLLAMMNAAVMPNAGPKLLLACAPGDLHEIGLILLALSLRRRGFVVVYLGSNLITNEFHQVLERVRPQLVCISAATVESVQNLQNFIKEHQNLLSLETSFKKRIKQKPLLSFGGGAFIQRPAWISTTPGLYLGDTIENAVTKVQKLLVV
jgi:DNA-binding transcriptional regulator YhcF (GntR family)/methanogenic corrinoid protein MtbC1